jgi:hypothetical protein
MVRFGSGLIGSVWFWFDWFLGWFGFRFWFWFVWFGLYLGSDSGLIGSVWI